MKNGSTAKCHYANVKPERRERSTVPALASADGGPCKEAASAWEVLHHSIRHGNTIVQTAPS